jgi:hypothetical protein
MNRALFFHRAPLSALLLRTATVILLGAAATAHATTDGLAISGAPPTQAIMGQTYSFAPSVSNPGKRGLKFLIWNKPAWATFSATTGHLAGTPAAGNVGTQNYVRIAVSDGVVNAYLPFFTLKVIAATSTPDKPVISGSPSTSATAGSAYKFQPTAKDPAGKTLAFSVQNKPSWASFSISSGLLAGTPTSSQSGTYGNIVISASNGQYSSALPAFSVTVKGVTSSTGSAALHWVVPTENTNGTALTDLAGIRIYYGTSAANLNQMVQLASTSQTSYTVSNLAAGVWYFASRAYTTTGVQSAWSSVVSKTIP